MKNISNIVPRSLNQEIFIRAYNTAMKYSYGSDYLFDSVWSFERGYRYNFKGTHPVLYLAGDHLVASTEIGARTSEDLLLPHLKTPPSTYIYFGVHVSANLLDLTDASVRRHIGVRLKDLIIPTEQWDEDMDKGIWSVTHKVGKAALAAGCFDGILYPPYPATSPIKIRGKHNIALFMDPHAPQMAKPLHASVKLEVIDNGGVLKTLGLIF
jgi:RES domain-containing protein